VLIRGSGNSLQFVHPQKYWFSCAYAYSGYYLCLMSIVAYILYSYILIYCYQVADGGCSNMDIGYTYTANSYYTSRVWRI